MSAVDVSERPTLSWNVMTRFRAYVLGAGGRIEVTDGAVDRGESFEFPYVASSRDDGTELHRFGGSVRFLAHGGALDLLIRDPWLHRDGTDTRVSIEGTEATRTAGRRLMFARIDGERTTLHPDGEVAFDFRYPAGTELAPVRSVLPQSDTAPRYSHVKGDTP